MNADPILVLTRAEVETLLTMDECILAVEQAFRAYGTGKAAAPAVLSMHAERGGFHVKAGVLELGRPYFGAKVNANFPENPSRYGLPTIQGMVVLCDAENGSPLAIMESGVITAMRTAAATAVAAKLLARQDSRVVTICGCGVQGRMHAEALARVFPLEMVFAYDKDAEQAKRFQRDVEKGLAVEVACAAELTMAVTQSDICVTCTPSREPLLGSGDVPAGIFIAAVGADNPKKQELHPSVMAGSKIVVDVFEQCAAMGDLHHALEAGAVSRSDVHAELGQVVAGTKPGRESEDEIIVFDSTGMALQDVAAAAALYEKAQHRGSGIRLQLAS